MTPQARPGEREHARRQRSAAWIAALIMMALADVLTRLVVIYLRGRRLTTGAPAPVASLAGGVGA